VVRVVDKVEPDVRKVSQLIRSVIEDRGQTHMGKTPSEQRTTISVVQGIRKKFKRR
jgi:hypothetical protein